LESWAVVLGAGYNVPNLRVDLGYQHAFFDSVSSSPPEVARHVQHLSTWSRWG
jgi:hypothetical protein